MLPTQGGSAATVTSTVLSEVGSVVSVVGLVTGSVGSTDMVKSSAVGGAFGPLSLFLSPFLSSSRRRRLRCARAGVSVHERELRRKINATNEIVRDRPRMLRSFVWNGQRGQ